MIKAVIFDMDGTVFDTEWIYRLGWQTAAEAFRFADALDEIMPDICGRNRNDIRAYFLNRYSKAFPFDDVVAKRVDAVKKLLLANGLQMKPGFPEVFESLHAMGISTALATATNAQTVHSYLQQANIRHHFDAILTGNDVTRSKPDPEIFLAAAKHLACKPDQCVVVEDSKNGVEAGNRAGMRVIMIPDLQPCTEKMMPLLWHCLPDVTTLPDLIRQENDRLGKMKSD